MRSNTSKNYEMLTIQLIKECEMNDETLKTYAQLRELEMDDTEMKPRHWLLIVAIVGFAFCFLVGTIGIVSYRNSYRDGKTAQTCIQNGGVWHEGSCLFSRK